MKTFTFFRFFVQKIDDFIKKIPGQLKTFFSNPTHLKNGLMNNLVPLLFLALCLISLPLSGFSLEYIVRELLARISRNSFLVLALLIPILAGMGLNFGMVLGAMSGQIAIILVINWGIVSIPGVFLAMILSIPLSLLAGIFCGNVLNKARGYEMVTGYILAFFINGLYQLIVLFFMGKLIPIQNTDILLSRGYGIRSSIDLVTLRQSIENWASIPIGNFNIPILTTILIVALAFAIRWFYNTKLGQDMRAVGQDSQVARSMGIHVDKIRIKSIVISTIVAGLGMILYLQNIGTLNTYNSHEQIGLFSIAALLVGGGSVNRANISHVFVGLILFHTMFIISPAAGKNLFHNAGLGEYFRVFISYAVIAFALILYAIRQNRKKNKENLAISLGL